MLQFGPLTFIIVTHNSDLLVNDGDNSWSHSGTPAYHYPEAPEARSARFPDQVPQEDREGEGSSV
jgi:hypothetical protein